MSNIENLLRRQYEGVITPEEQSELDRLTHRDQVIEAATRRAQVLRHRRLAGATGMASVLLIAGTIFFVNPSADGIANDGPMLAQTQIPEMVAPKVAEPVSAPTTALAEPVSTGSDKLVAVETEPAIKQTIVRQNEAPTVGTENEQPVVDEEVNDVQHTIISAGEPIVACNTACSPDSVINDIWKFLRT
jgi:hypothetical protein